MLERLVKSAATVRILSVLLFGKRAHTREIARRARITPMHAQVELESLAKLGIVKDRRVGNLRVWEANRWSPIYNELRSIFLKTECLGDYLQGVFGRFDVKYALVFGSFARGEEKERSDVDVLVVGNAGFDELGLAVSKAEERLGREINYILWSEKEFEKKAQEGHHLLREIVKHPMIWLHGDERGFRKTVPRRAD